MAEMKGVTDHNRISNWIENSKKNAQRLLVEVDDISEAMFKSGNLSNFFLLLSRFSYFDYKNILLLSKQYPLATNLAGYNTWKGMAPPNSLILKKEHQGKGISLLAPFTEVRDGKPTLIWFTVNMYDITQTTLTENKYIKSPYVARKKQHIEYLLKSFMAFIYNELDVEFSFSLTEMHKQTGIPCYLKGKTIHINPNADELEQLSYMIEFTIKKSTKPELSDKMLEYLASSVRDCLFEMWNLPKQITLAPPYEEISAMPIEKQKVFLNQAQQWTRAIEDMVLFEYIKNKNNNTVIEDDFLDNLFQ